MSSGDIYIASSERAWRFENIRIKVFRMGQSRTSYEIDRKVSSYVQRLQAEGAEHVMQPDLLMQLELAVQSSAFAEVPLGMHLRDDYVHQIIPRGRMHMCTAITQRTPAEQVYDASPDAVALTAEAQPAPQLRSLVEPLPYPLSVRWRGW